MAKLNKHNNFDVYTISSADGKTTASFVPQKGGVCSSIIMPFANQERELLFQHDEFWDQEIKNLPGAWPFIFPICARIERQGIAGDYLYDGHIYNMPIHGISWWLPWQVSNATDDEITLIFTDSKETLERYPFSFRIELHYKISDKMLTCTQHYFNTGDKSMPYSAGFHPYFLTPKANSGKEKVLLTYHPKRRFKYNERLSDLIGEQELLPSPISIADPRINEQLVQLGGDKKVCLDYPDGMKINIEAVGAKDTEMYSYVQIYTPAQESFICVEPWTSFPNALNTVAGVRWLRPGEKDVGIVKVWL